MSAVGEAFEDHARVLQAARALVPQVQELATRAIRCLRAGGKVIACGNGGSAADAQHFAAELVGRFARERRALPAIALGVDPALTTALANDYEFARVFARPVEALARPGDMLIALSTSGRSPNVLAAARAAKAAGCVVGALTGSGGAMLADLADVAVVVPSADVARIQEIHGLCLHAVAGEIEAQLFAEGAS
jgi:D-sedoheptulose 7-phosphate isomerase